MLATSCYTREELQRYLHGRAEDDLSSAIECHLESCSSCEDTLAELDTNDDTLIRTLQVRGSSQRAPAWVEQLASTPHGTAAEERDADQDAAAERPDVLGDYELVRVLGRGGMSVVFAARHKHLGREVALKVLLPATQQHAVSRDRFAREMKAVGGLDHPAIVRATDAGEWNETLYLVMEQIDGFDLNRVSRCEGPLRVADACAIGIQAARGLAHAHDLGVVHRDIKPSNLMLDRKGQIKILDFGLARVQSASCDVSLQTTMGQLLGTLDYMAPEQAGGTEVDARADIYALGATLFKLLTGAPPHGRSADMPIIEFLNRLATSEAAAIDAHRDQLPGELVELIGAMLRRDAARRVATAEEVAERLRPFAAGADLRQLAARAAERTTDSPESSMPSIKESLAEFWPQPQSGREPPQSQAAISVAAEQRSSDPLGWAGRAAAVAGLLGLVVLTIVLTLKSPQGDIRIESELDNVSVEVADEQERVQTIAVDQGGTTTTVRAGRYRIRLDSPSNGIEVTPQQVTVKRNETVIARVTKVAAARPDEDAGFPQRDPLVAMEAQLQLAETAAELAEAKKEPDQNADRIKTLEEKLASLRALSRPIPTEPVYEGRTLADWVAQMKFEQEHDARKTAAENVLQLARTRPPDEQLELILDAGSRLFAWGGSSIDQELWSELYPGGSSSRLTKPADLVAAADREVASAHLARAAGSAEQPRRDYALLLCADLRHQIRQGDWPTLLTALEARSESDTGSARAVSQLALAVCIPDGSRAAKLLAAVDTDAASEATLIALLHAAQERKLEIPREREIAWVAAYLGKMSFVGLEPVFQQPLVGPFRNVDWDRVDDDIQVDINSVVGPLLDSFEQRLVEARDNEHDQQLQLAAALKSRILTKIVEQANLTGRARDRAVGLLRQRLDQLIRFRSQAAEPLYYDMDTPAEVAIAVLLLTGSVPEAIKDGSLLESGFLAEQLAAARKTLLPRDGSIMIRGDQGGFMRGGSQVQRLADWHPYELLAVLHDASSRMRTEIRSASQSGRPRRYTTLSDLLRFQPPWQVDPRLMIEYAMSSANDNVFPGLSAAEFTSEFAGDDNSARAITPHLVRHPQFAARVTEWLEKVQNQEAVEFGFELWSAAQSSEAAEAKLQVWLKSGDVIRTRTAIQALAARDRQRFHTEWATDVAQAIDRIAQQQQLNSRDLFFLDLLGDTAPGAAQQAISFLTFWLDNPDQRARQAEISGLGRGASALTPSVNILRRYPEQARQVRAQVEQALAEPKDPVANDPDVTQLQRLWEFISDLPE